MSFEFRGLTFDTIAWILNFSPALFARIIAIGVPSPRNIVVTGDLLMLFPFFFFRQPEIESPYPYGKSYSPPPWTFLPAFLPPPTLPGAPRYGFLFATVEGGFTFDDGYTVVVLTDQTQYKMCVHLPNLPPSSLWDGLVPRGLSSSSYFLPLRSNHKALSSP